MNILSAIIKPVIDLTDKILTNKAEAEKFKVEFQSLIVNQYANVIEKEIDARAATLSAELSGNFFQRTWRPVLMMTFNIIIFFNYIIAPIFKIEMLPIPPEMWTLIQLSVAGYIGARSIEKIFEIKNNGKSKE